MILIAAIAVGAIAAFMIFNYVGGVEDQANEGAERVSVFVVRQDIPKGMTGEEAGQEGYIVQDKIAREFLPATAIASLDQIAGRVSLNAIAANQVVVDDMFVDPAEAQIGFSERLPESSVAVTLSFDTVRGVAGLLVPGDEVDLLYTDENGTHFAYHQAEILAIGQTASPQPGENITAASTEEGDDAAAAAPAAPANDGSGLITFIVPPEAAQFLVSLDPGQMYLALTGPEYTPEPIPVLDLTTETTFPGEDGNQLTPYGPSGREE